MPIPHVKQVKVSLFCLIDDGVVCMFVNAF